MECRVLIPLAPRSVAAVSEPESELASPVTFTADAVLDLLRGVCEASGVDFRGAEVLQPPADNAMVLVPSVDLVARIGVDVSHHGRLEQELRALRGSASRACIPRRPPMPRHVHNSARSRAAS